MNRIRDIEKHGQSIWFDYIQRGMIWNGTLYRMMKEDGVKGVTSNPAIFEKAIGGSPDYAPAIKSVVKAGASAIEAFETLAVRDIQLACDVLREVYDATGGKDGFVSLEVSPHLAYDTTGTIADGLRLWEMVGRDNLMIKVPATKEGVPAIEALISEGINVNVTLLFAVDRYVEVHHAFMSGLEKRMLRGGDISNVSSVASFFVSRIDGKIDKMLSERASSASGDQKSALESLKGKIAIANAKMAYQAYEKDIDDQRWQKLKDAGAQVQRLLWASTSTKDPSYSDVLYMETLIGPETVNTVPEKTYEAFQDHGDVKSTLKDGMDEAAETMQRLANVDISMDLVTSQLEEEGVVKFAEAFDRLMATVESRRREILGEQIPEATYALGSAKDAVDTRLESLAKNGFARRMWARDATLWSSDEKDFEGISGFMGWLDAVDAMLDAEDHLFELQDDLDDAGITDVLLMGMGGSSLAAEVFSRTFGQQPESAKLSVLDSTVPAQVRAREAGLDLDSSVFVVASKSGSTTEPLAFHSYFANRVPDGAQYIAITDPDSQLDNLAHERQFHAVYSGDPEIGGRYSALSPFGMVPAAAMGLDTAELLRRARRMVGSCDASVPPAHNPGVYLGAALGELALAGKDKLTLVTSKTLTAFGGWLEQLVAESTGKQNKGIVPVDGEQLAAPEAYGTDRVFAFIHLASDDTNEAQARLEALENAGHPVIRFALTDAEDLVQEMFRWEVATATAAHVLEINPFDQPNVQESKNYTSQFLRTFEEEASLPAVPGEVKIYSGEGLSIYTTEQGRKPLDGASDLKSLLGAHLGQAGVGDYVAINAFVEMSDENDAPLQTLRHKVRDTRHVATTVGFGPRFLHSTGQLHKGGKNSGVFLQITGKDQDDLAVPGRKYSFSVLKRAQEAGDFMALASRERRLLRIHIEGDVAEGLAKIAAAV